MSTRNASRTLAAILSVALVGGLAIIADSAGAATPVSPWWALTTEQTPAHLPPGGEGKIIVAATDIGDAGVNATHVPLAVRDTLPPGLEATAVTWNVGFGSPSYHEQWPTSLLPPCVNTGQTVSCTMEPFEPFLPVAALEPNERIELEVSVKVRPGAGGGEVDEAEVSGGEPLVCHEVGPEAGGFTDGSCAGEYPFSSPFIPSNVQGRDFEQEATGHPVPAAQAARPVVISGEPVPFGIEQYDVSPEEAGGGADGKAGSHPAQLTTSFVLNQRLERTRGLNEGAANADTLPALPKNLSFELPPGLIGNPTAVPRCSAAQFFSKPTTGSVIDECPADTAVGVAMLTFDEPSNLQLVTTPVPVFNIEPTLGEPARFGFFAGGVLPVVLDTSLRTGGDYGVTVTAHRVPEVSALLSSQVTFWGEPGNPSHDAQRGWSCVAGGFYSRLGEVLPSCAASQGSGGEATPFLRLPTSCNGPLRAPLRIQSWLAGASFLAPFESGQTTATGACNRLPFDPQIEVVPDVHAAASPTGLNVDLTVPQEASEAPGGLAEADLKDVKVTLPAGVVVNPSSANGLGACTPEQVELHGPEPARCPEAAKIGSVRIDTPLLERPLEGAVYVAAPHENPFGSLLAIYVAVDDPQDGVVVKLAGQVIPDPGTGQLTTVFSENPQLPFEEFKLHFFGGPQAALQTPDLCGEYSTATEMTPWSSPEGPDAQPSSSFSIGAGPEGSGCSRTPAEEPNKPAFSAGTVAPLAGSYSPFVLHLTRADGSQVFRALNVTLPAGLTGRLAGIRYCPDAAIAAAAGKSGSAERAAPSCPAGSEVGKVTVGAGAGPQPYFVTGKAYLAGPYKGAPLSLVIITPAVAGPYDLGTVVVRSALYVNEETTQITVKSDPIPTILQGIPLDVRSISVEMNKPEFTINPTSCEAKEVTGTEISSLGNAAALQSRFQVGGCGGLGFKPNLKIQLRGATKRVGHPALKAVLTAKPGEADIARAQVNLPQGEFLDQGNLNKTCTKPVLLAGNCPKTAIYGKARAWTPLLEAPLEGPVYLVGGYGYKLPALVAELNGQIRVVLKSKVDSGPNKGIRSTFEAVPDAPVSRFVLEMKGGKKYGLLQNSENLCKASKADRRAVVRFTGQNGKVDQFKPEVANQCGKGKKGAKRKKGK